MTEAERQRIFEIIRTIKRDIIMPNPNEAEGDHMERANRIMGAFMGLDVFVSRAFGSKALECTKLMRSAQLDEDSDKIYNFRRSYDDIMQ